MPYPLLGVSVTAIFICVQFSLPLSLGLLGALSIVRFRTPIKEPEEISFIMLVIATSLSCATFNLTFCALILVMGLSAIIAPRLGKNLFRSVQDGGMVVITVPTSPYKEHGQAIVTLLENKLPAAKLNSLCEKTDEVVVTYEFGSLKSDSLLAIRECVKELVPAATVIAFYSRPT